MTDGVPIGFLTVDPSTLITEAFAAISPPPDVATSTKAPVYFRAELLTTMSHTRLNSLDISASLEL